MTMEGMIERKALQHRRNFSIPRDRQKGASLLEFTIILLFALPLLSATIDYGFGLRRLQVLAQAARLGVREAAATRAFALCNSPSGGADCLPTQYGANGEVVTPAQVDSVACLAEVTARDFLLLPAHRSKMKADDYDITSEVYVADPVDGVTARMVRVELRRRPETIGCTFCYSNIFQNFTDTAESSMAIVSNCTL